jgi:predicted Zn-dependent protease
MRKQCIRSLFAVVGLLAGGSAALAQNDSGKSTGTLLAPDAVLLYAHKELKSTDFIEPLVCALRRVLVAPVEVQSAEVPLGPDSLAGPGQFDVGKVADRFKQATAADAGARTFKYLLLPHDIKDAQFRFVFATSFGSAKTADHVGVVSTARLDVPAPDLSRRQRAEITALRAYKLILKSIARLAGYPDLQRCILAFPRNIDELDRKASEFCAPDRAALVAAGILKAEESAGCVYVSERAHMTPAGMEVVKRPARP